MEPQGQAKAQSRAALSAWEWLQLLHIPMQRCISCLRSGVILDGEPWGASTSPWQCPASLPLCHIHLWSFTGCLLSLLSIPLQAVPNPTQHLPLLTPPSLLSSYLPNYSSCLPNELRHAYVKSSRLKVMHISHQPCASDWSDPAVVQSVRAEMS